MINPAFKPIIRSMAFIAFAVALLFGAMLVTSDNVLAQNTDKAKEGIGLTCTGDGCGDGDAEGALGNIVGAVIDILSIVVGAVSVIMIIVGGFRYVTSAGDSSKTQSAKNTILYAIVGLVVVIFAQVIVNFVVGTIENGGTGGGDSEEDGGDSGSLQISLPEHIA